MVTAPSHGLPAVLARLEQELALELKDKAPSQQEEFLFRRAIVELA